MDIDHILETDSIPKEIEHILNENDLDGKNIESIINDLKIEGNNHIKSQLYDFENEIQKTMILSNSDDKNDNDINLSDIEKNLEKTIGDKFAKLFEGKKDSKKTINDQNNILLDRRNSDIKYPEKDLQQIPRELIVSNGSSNNHSFFDISLYLKELNKFSSKTNLNVDKTKSIGNNIEKNEELWGKCVQDASSNIEKEYSKNSPQKCKQMEINFNDQDYIQYNYENSDIKMKEISYDRKEESQELDLDSKDMIGFVIFKSTSIFKYIFNDYETSKLLRFYENQDINKTIINLQNRSIFLKILKVYFCLNQNDKFLLLYKKLKKVENSVELQLWKGLLNFRMLIKNMKEKSPKCKLIAQKCQKIFIKILKQDKNSLISLFCLLEISILIESHQKEWQLKLLNPPNVYAKEITILNHFFGYLASIEIYLNSGEAGSTQKCIKYLHELISADQSSLIGYLKLFQIYYLKKDNRKYYGKLLEIFDPLLFNESINSNEITKSTLWIYYSKALILNQKGIVGLEYFNRIFNTNSKRYSILYLMAKQAFFMNNSETIDLAISLLRECNLFCISELQGVINYYLGRLYLEKKDQLMISLLYFDKCLSFENLNAQKKKYAIEQMQQFKELIFNVKSILSIISKNKIKSNLPRIPQVPHNFSLTLEKINKIDKMFRIILEAKVKFYLGNNLSEANDILLKYVKEGNNKIELIIELLKFNLNQRNSEILIKNLYSLFQLIRNDSWTNEIFIKSLILVSRILKRFGQIATAITCMKKLRFLLPNLNLINDLLPILGFNIDLIVINSTFIWNNEYKTYLKIKNNFKNEEQKVQKEQKEQKKQKEQSKSIEYNLKTKYSNEDNLNMSRKHYQIFCEFYKNRKNEKLFPNSESYHYIEKICSEVQNDNYEKLFIIFKANSRAKFLYYEGKYSIQYNINNYEGIQSLFEYIYLVKFLKSINSNIQNKQNLSLIKSKFWIGIGLFNLNYNSESMTILSEIVNELSSIKSRMRNTAQEIISFIYKQYIFKTPVNFTYFE